MMNNGNYGVWFEYVHSNPQAHFRLFCFHHVGGSASVFRGWSSGLPDVEVRPVQLPGREKRLREKPFSRLPLLVQAIADVLPFDKPFAFFGHSMGALLSFELARELRRRRRPGPAYLFLSAHSEPERMIYADPPRHLLPDHALVDELRSMKITAEIVLQDASLMAMWLPVIRADYALAETYVYSPEAPLDCPIKAFGGAQDRYASQDQMQAWRNQTSDSFSLSMFSGGHFFLYEVLPQVITEISKTMNVVAFAGY